MLDLLFWLHAPVLEPDLDLSLRQAERVCDLNSAFAREVAVELELLLELESLVARVGLAAAATLWRVRTCDKDTDNADMY